MKILLGFSFFLALFLCASRLKAQQDAPAAIADALSQPSTPASAGLPDAPDPQSQQTPLPSPAQGGSAQSTANPHSTEGAAPQNQTPPPQPKRILGLMPNYRAVSAGTIPPPPTPKQAFKIATLNSFDYSSFVFTGLTSLIAEGDNDHPQLGKGVPGFGRYYWRGFLDKTDGNYWVIFALPTVFHEDERYFALGRGSILKRAVYATTRILITPNYDGQNTVNLSELLGRGIAQGISVTYYPSASDTASALASKYAYALLRDAGTNAFREFWPDIAVHVLHRSP